MDCEKHTWQRIPFVLGKTFEYTPQGIFIRITALRNSKLISIIGVFMDK